MKYFRTYPWGLQLLLFLLMAFTFMSSASVIILSLLPKLTGILPAQLGVINAATPPSVVNATLTMEGVLNLFSWLLPAFIFAYLTHPKAVAYIGLNAPRKMIQPVLAILVMLGAMPLLELMDGLMSHINFGHSIAASQQANEDMMTAFLTMPDWTSFIRVFLVLAIIPAMGEEMFFRGVFMRFVAKKSTGIYIPVIFSAFIFAFAHFNVYGFISILLAGILLAVIYWLTGSLWCSILAHMFFNGSQIILAFAGNYNPAIKNYVANTSAPAYLVIGGLIVFSISFYLLLKNKTPLPPDWTNDFKGSFPTPIETENV